MELWAMWVGVLDSVLQIMAVDLGLGTGLAIVTLTIALRIALLPISFSGSWSACVHQHRMRRLRPQLEQARKRFGEDAARLAEATLDIYRRNGVAMINARPIVSSLVQMPAVLGMFQLLRSGLEQARFLWIASLARPDFWFAVAAAATTALMMAANPEIPEHTRMLMIWLPAVITFVFALKFASALAIYWAVSNCFAAAQTAAVHHFVDRRIRAGKLKIQ